MTLPLIVICPAKGRLDFCQQHREVKRLCNKVVCPHVDGHNDVNVFRRRGQEKHRNLGNPANFLTPVVPIEKRQRDIHEDKVGLEFHKFSQNGGEVLGAFYGEVPGG